MSLTGEQTQELGREGAMRAKRWLEASCRADVPFDNPSFGHKLQFAKADGRGNFSYDLGGFLRGGDLEGQEFYAEVKHYRSVGDQGTLYKQYLAQCYRAFDLQPHRCDHFMWITWCPFSVSSWQELMSAATVRDAVTDNADIALGDDEVDDSKCAEVADRLWLIVLSDKQENLVVDHELRHRVVAHLKELRGT